MCGIVGVVGAKDAGRTLVAGLQRLEYRGYDSAGIAIATREGVLVERAVGAVSNLAALALPAGTVGIGHTRWATHGAPSEENAHPHQDCTRRLAVVHNGIIENFAELREKLEANGHVFASETDTEVLAHLIEDNLEGDLLAAVRKALTLVEGAYALAVVSADQEDRIIAARHRSPLLIGLAGDLTLLASDATAVLDHTRKVAYLDDGDVAEIEGSRVRVWDARGAEKPLVVHELGWTLESAEKSGFDHFMLKEIHETPEALHHALRGRLAELGSRFDMEGRLGERALRTAQRIVLVACGTSHYAGLVGKGILEALAGVPVDVQLASEFRYAPGLRQENALAIFVSQSGETADTLEALRRAQQLGWSTLAFVNVVGSSLAREAQGVYHLRAGPEIGVASTKAFVNTLAGFHLLGTHLGLANGNLTPQDGKRLVSELRTLPRLAQQALEREAEARVAARELLGGKRDAFFLGRQANHGLALEGALKLKEISYVHAEGYAAGELKHGPLALVERDFPVVALVAQKEPTHAVMMSNVGEVRARGAKVLALANESDAKVAKHADLVLRVPDCDALLYPIPAAVVLYLLAYHAARERGCPIDRPRNLAKSVTVE